MVFAYLGEFLEPRKRDSYLSRLELFWTFGIIALPGNKLLFKFNQKNHMK